MSVLNDQLLFVHIPKTGGTSVKRLLWDSLPGCRGQRPDHWDEGPYDNAGLPIGHVRLQDIERFTGRTPDSFKTILAIIRNPYTQQVSQWSFWADRWARGGRHQHDITAAKHADMGSWLEDPMSDFHLWYEHKFDPGRPNLPLDAPANRYTDFGGFYFYWLAVDNQIPDNVRIVTFERLNEDMPSLLTPFLGFTPELPHMNRTGEKRKIHEYYTLRAAELVEAKFRWTFHHGIYEKLPRAILRAR